MSPRCYQQGINKHALEIAELYPVDKDRWIREATLLRFPYWDWAFDAVPPREVIADPTVKIITPESAWSGETVEVENPLFKYQFPKDRYKELGGFPTTARYPNQKGQSNPGELAKLVSLPYAMCCDIDDFR